VGHLVMRPPPRSRHAEYQTEIAIALRRLMQGGRSIVECPLQTREGVKAIAVVWVSHARRASDQRPGVTSSPPRFASRSNRLQTHPRSCRSAADFASKKAPGMVAVRHRGADDVLRSDRLHAALRALP